MEIAEGPGPKTEILYGPESAVSRGASFMARAKKRMDLCYGKKAPSIVIEVDAYRNGYREMRARGGKIRIITEITRENIAYCKRLEEIVDELRHRDGVEGGMAVSEGEYMATTAEFQEGKPLTQVIYSNASVLVAQQQYIFDSIWSSAIPARAKYAEIEDGIEPQVTHIIARADELYDRLYSLVESANHQVLVMSSDSDILLSHNIAQELARRLKEASSKGLDIRVLIPSLKDPSAKQVADRMKTAAGPRVNIGTLREDVGKNITIAVADKKKVVFGVLGDKSSASQQQKEGQQGELGIYSNNNSIASSYSLLIESLWTHIETYRKLQELDELKEEFVNIAAHELRTPVLPIMLTAESLADDATVDGEKIDIILRNAARLNRLTNQILDISRLESNTFKLRKDPADMLMIIRDVVSNPAFHANPAIRIVTKSCLGNEEERKKIAKICFDKDRITEVLSNILDNAVKFTANGGTITVSVRTEGDSLLVEVSDTGTGIDMSIRDRLFTKFATKSTTQLKGTGLGLYLCKKVIEAHGGRIWAKNNDDGKGATFGFTLPLTDARKDGDDAINSNATVTS
jgi:two-component system sensor histidine kinase VicK